MRLVLAGAWKYKIYEEACANALARLGIEVIPFSWGKYFDSFIGRIENKWTLPGPRTFALNHDFISAANATNPEVILVWRGTHIWPSSLKRVRSGGPTLLVSYNHDDFSNINAIGSVPFHHHIYWRHFLSCAPLYDIHLVKRRANIAHLSSLGVKHSYIFPMYFVPELHRPVSLTEQELDVYGCDVVFVGHYEPDGREAYLRALVQGGLRVRLFGGKYWTRRVLGDLADYFGEIRPAQGDDYAKALCGAKMCLCFLSRLNRDTYTRRCYEIPACGRLLLSERTEDLQHMFKEDEEAVFFSTPEELVEKASWLRDHPEEIERIAQAGMRRVHADGHSVDARMQEFLSILKFQHST
jgi:spore maturation protein CgeB